MKIVAQICIFDSRVSIFYWRSEHGRMSAAYHDSGKFLFLYHCESDMLLILLNIVITDRSSESNQSVHGFLTRTVNVSLDYKHEVCRRENSFGSTETSSMVGSENIRTAC